MKRDEVIKIMQLIATEKGARFPVTVERIDLWHEILGHVDFAHARAATMRLLSEATDWPPDAGNVRQIAKVVAVEEATRSAVRRDMQVKMDAPTMTPEEEKASRERVSALLRGCLEKLSAKCVQ